MRVERAFDPLLKAGSGLSNREVASELANNRINERR